MAESDTDDEVWREERLFVGGTLGEAAGGATFENTDPSTEVVIGVAADGSCGDMDDAIGAARGAFDEGTWAGDVAFRVRCVRQLHDALASHAEQLRRTLVAEVGCPVALTKGPQLDLPIAGVAWMAEFLDSYEWETDLGDSEPMGIPSHREVWREPVGVVGAITPWNFPIQINLAKVVAALAAGNSVVLKPAPDTPWSATLLGRIVCEETDIPAGVFNVVPSSDHLLGQQLAEDARVDLVSFTGSTATGRKVMAAASTNLKKVFLELGGKSAAVVLGDADVAAAAGSTAFQILTHAGQGCAITSRLILPRQRLDEGLEALLATISALPYGDPTDPGNIMGPLISERQRQRVLGYIDKGVEQGARVAMGGAVPAHLRTGYYVEPTVLVDVDPDATVAQEEIFGPVLVVLTHDGSDEDAVAVANNSVYGLSGAIFSGSIDHAREVARLIRTGTISLNNGLWFGPDVPFGGYKQSGIGREMGREGFDEYLETKSIGQPA